MTGFVGMIPAVMKVPPQEVEAQLCANSLWRPVTTGFLLSFKHVAVFDRSKFPDPEEKKLRGIMNKEHNGIFLNQFRRNGHTPSFTAPRCVGELRVTNSFCSISPFFLKFFRHCLSFRKSMTGKLEVTNTNS